MIDRKEWLWKEVVKQEVFLQYAISSPDGHLMYIQLRGSMSRGEAVQTFKLCLGHIRVVAFRVSGSLFFMFRFVNFTL